METEAHVSNWARQIDAKREQHSASSSHSFGSVSHSTTSRQEHYSRSKSYNEDERDSRGESMDESGSDGAMEEDIDELKHEVRGLLKDLRHPIKGKSLHPQGSFVNFFLDYRYCSCPTTEMCIKCNHQIKHHTPHGATDPEEENDAEYKVEEDSHYKAMSDGEWTAEDTADDDTADEDGEHEKTQELEMEVNDLIEEQKEAVNGKSLEKHRGQLHYKYCVCDDRVERKRTKSQHNIKNPLCIKCNHEIQPNEDILSGHSGFRHDMDSSSESSEESDEQSETDFEMEVKQIFHGITDPIKPPIDDIFQGVDYIDKDKEEYQKEEDKDYIIQEDPRFKEKDSDVSSSASESDSDASDDDMDVAELEIEVAKLYNDLDKPVQDIFGGIDYTEGDGAEGPKDEDDEDYIVEEDPDFGKGSSGESSADDSESDEEMDEDEIKSEVSKLFHDLEKPVNGKSFVLRHREDSDHPEMRKKYRYCGCAEPLRADEPKPDCGEPVICHECDHQKLQSLSISDGDETADSQDEEAEDANPGDVCEAAGMESASSPLPDIASEEGPIVGLEDYKEEEDEDYIADSGEETADTADDDADTAEDASADDSFSASASDSGQDSAK